jgi:hypothetical protein
MSGKGIMSRQSIGDQLEFNNGTGSEFVGQPMTGTPQGVGAPMPDAVGNLFGMRTSSSCTVTIPMNMPLMPHMHMSAEAMQHQHQQKPLEFRRKEMFLSYKYRFSPKDLGQNADFLTSKLGHETLKALGCQLVGREAKYIIPYRVSLVESDNSGPLPLIANATWLHTPMYATSTGQIGSFCVPTGVRSFACNERTILAVCEDDLTFLLANKACIGLTRESIKTDLVQGLSEDNTQIYTVKAGTPTYELCVIQNKQQADPPAAGYVLDGTQYGHLVADVAAMAAKLEKFVIRVDKQLPIALTFELPARSAVANPAAPDMGKLTEEAAKSITGDANLQTHLFTSDINASFTLDVQYIAIQ